jgi:hypothetical protein
MSVNTEVKGTLAKLLATENLNVEHRNVETAYFDVLNRILCLPIWKDVSADVYDMLVGHEVGHALYTPVDYGAVSQTVPQDILNVLEDVRVEKLMKRRYPGLAKSFFRGYTELDEKNFFEIQGKDLSKMSLIDRINVHFKCGVFGNRTIVPFEREEMQWVNRTAETETFDDMVDLAMELTEYLKRKKEEMQKVEAPAPAQSDAGGAETPQEEQTQSGPIDSEQEGTGSSTEQTTQDGGDTTQEMSDGPGPLGGRNEVADEFTSETYRALTDNQQNLVDKKAREYVYTSIPTVNLNNMIVSYKKTFADFTKYASEQKDKYEKSYDCILQKYRDYKKESIKTVNYLAKEFECKKAADQYHRANTANTGVLDTQKLHTFKWNEDLFKKVTSLPDGKNHGLVFYLDWSGSMSNSMVATLKQLYDLMWFCKKVGIPFRVYAFSDARHNDHLFPGIPVENKVNYMNIDSSFRLFEFFSSKMNAQTLDKMMEYMFYNCEHFYSYSTEGQYNYEYSLSGTPLAETIITTPQVIEKFKSEEKVQKVNVVYLSDGESAYPQYNKLVPALKEVVAQPMYGDRVYVLRDPKSRYQRQMEFDRNGITNSFVNYISNIVDCNLLGFRLCTKSEIRLQASLANMDFVQVGNLIKDWEKNKSVAISNCGFKELYLMQLPKENINNYRYWNPDGKKNDNEIEVKENATKGQLATAFKKHMTGKMINKTILSKFVGQVA